MAQYPERLKNLLIKAGLIGKGVKVIMAYHNNKKRLTLDEQSNTWIEDPDEYEIDFREANEYIIPVFHNGQIVGDWRTGLTSEEVELIHQEAGVPLFERNQSYRINHGMRLDLSNPRDMAFYRIAVNSGAIAENRNRMTGLQRFYWHDETLVMEEKRTERRTRRRIIQQMNKVSSDKLRLVYDYINLKYRKGWNHNPSIDEIEGELMDMALSDAYINIANAFDNELLEVEVTVLRALEYDLLIRDSASGQVARPSGELLGLDTTAAAKKLVADKGTLKSLRMKLAELGFGKDQAADVKSAEDVEQVEYDTVIYDEQTVKYWNTEACRQYLKEHGVQHDLKATDSVDRWRKTVLKHYEQSLGADGESVRVVGAKTAKK